jgi:hypothetical protein
MVLIVGIIGILCALGLVALVLKGSIRATFEEPGVVVFARREEDFASTCLYDQPGGNFLGCFGPMAAKNVPGLSDLELEDGYRAIRIEALP